MRTAHDVVCTECGRVLGTGRSTCPVDGAKTERRPRAFTGSVLARRYRLDDVLGRGGWATVYRARDLREDTDVAVKVLSPALRADSRSVKRFIDEAQTLAGLHHPHVVTVLDCAQSGRWVFLVLELLEGRSLAEEIVRHAPFDPARAVRVALQICDGIGAAHDRGVVHRDLKPDNVLLLGGRDLWVKVADFGIAHSLLDGGPRSRFAGTPAYSSPEQGRGDPLDGRSDLYALGLILYEMLSGEPAFPREGGAATLLRRNRESPPDIGRKVPDLPDGLGAAITRLLARDPEHRPRTAADVRALLAAHGGGSEAAVAAEPAAVDDFRFAPLDFAPPLCGRDEDLTTLAPFVDRLGDFPHATLLVLSGAGGVGKSRLASRLADTACEKRGARRYEKECGDPGRPLYGLAEVIEDLLGTKDLDAKVLEQRLVHLLGDVHGAHELRTILRPAPVEMPAGGHDAAAQRDYRVHVVLEALARFATPRPLALVLDDAHRADALTRDVIARLPLWSRDRGKGLLFIVTWTPGAGDGPPADLSRERFAERARLIPVAPLSAEASETMLRAIGKLDTEARALIGRLAAGSPLAILQLVRHFAHEKLLLPTRRGWRLAPRTRFDLSVPYAIGALGTRQLDQLRTREGAGVLAADLLERVALIGERAPLAVLRGLLEREGRRDLLDPIEALLDLLAAEGLIHRLDGAVRFSHGLVREAIAAGASEHPDAARRHVAIAEAMLATGDDEKTARDAAFHLQRGGEVDRALPLALHAASLARAIGDVARASEDYLLALRSLEAQKTPDNAARLEVELGLGDTLLIRGETRQAEEHFMKALQISDGPDARFGLGRVAEHKGEYARARDHLARAEKRYRSEGRIREAAEATILLGRALERLGDLAGARQRFQQSQRRFARVGDAVGEARASMALGFLSAWTGDHADGCELLARAMPVFESLGTPMLVAECLSRLGAVRAEMGHHETAVDLYHRARTLLEHVGMLRGVAACLMGVGKERAHLGSPDEGARLLESALRLREDVQDEHGVGSCLVDLGTVCRMAGKLDESLQWLRAGVVHFQRLNASAGLVFARKELAATLMRLGSLDDARKEFHRVLTDSPGAAQPRIRAECLDALGDIAVARGKHGVARRRYSEAMKVYRSAGLLAEVALVRAKIAMLDRPRRA